MRSAARIALAAVGLCASVVHAQSTARIGEAGPPLRVELSVGMDREREYVGQSGTVTSAAFAARWTWQRRRSREAGDRGCSALGRIVADASLEHRLDYAKIPT